MGNSGFNASKAMSKKIKTKGLQRLRWYCQMCEKQCRDANGFKCHTMSEAHQRQMQLFSHNPKKFIEGFSSEFQSAYIQTLSRGHGTKAVDANLVYQEMIRDKDHLHMNATKWHSLTEFVTHLGKNGIAKVEETEKGWSIAWIDNSPETLARQAAMQKKERQEACDEDITRKLIERQVAQVQANKPVQTEEVTREFKRDEEAGPLKLTMHKVGTSTQIAKPNLFKMVKKERPNLLAVKPLKSLLKESSLVPVKRQIVEPVEKPISNLEAIMLEAKKYKESRISR